MKGLLLGNYYTNKKPIFIYSILGFLLCVLLSIYIPITSCFFLMMLMTTPATDNLKHDKETKWINFISTLPITRGKYILSQFVFYIMLTFLGCILSILALIIAQKDIGIVIISLIIGLSAVLQFSISYPLTFKFGVDKSNMVFMITSFFTIFIFYILYYFLHFINDGSLENISINFKQSLITSLIYLLLGIIVFLMSLSYTINMFKKLDL
ncbi:ABC-2 transporter permease [Staphylococcus pseudintermedius]|uniref:ABC-2 transporter permease n=1 Tax=Staphylococcus pseudintermedius TaxID=283734 RepID=UPI0035BFB88C